ncbi:MAG: helix-turn-helix domain-containing protein, partial [Croceibacterium sp.]
DETVAALFALLQNERPEPAIIRTRYTALAAREYALTAALKREATALDDAAAALLVEHGAAALTFRAVARQAGATLGAVAYHFGTKAELLRLAMERAYELNTASLAQAVQGNDQVPPGELLEGMVVSLARDPQPVLRAFDEIIHTICRQQEDSALRGAVRGFPDPIGNWLVGNLLQVEVAEPSLVAAFSSVVRGIGHWRETVPLADRETYIRQALLPFLGSGRN